MTITNQDLKESRTRITSTRNYFFRLGGLTCIVLTAYCVATMLIVFLLGPPPSTIEGYYIILKQNRLNGLLRLDILTVFAMSLYYLLFYSIYLAIKKESNQFNLFSLILVYAGLTLFLSAPSVFSYLSLSDKYSLAVTEVERNRIIAAGEAVLSMDIWHGTTAFIGGILLQTGGVLFSISMIKGDVFNKITGYTGVFIFGMDLIHILIGFVSPGVSNLIMVIAGTFYLLWFPLVGLRLFKLTVVTQI
ncbi:MAG TPA: hypothetical protein VMT35_14135 [Ignavibacteriaceae bacterium]|nr:hypothetical protein [Ignavibacteriaceae bacterium]